MFDKQEIKESIRVVLRDKYGNIKKEQMIKEDNTKGGTLNEQNTNKR